MTDKTLQKLSKRELLEILVNQGKQIDQLQQELRDTQAQLEVKELTVKNAGSLAEATVELNGVFKAADAACQQYIASIQAMEREQQETMERMRRKEQEAMELMERYRQAPPPQSEPELTDSGRLDDETI